MLSIPFPPGLALFVRISWRESCCPLRCLRPGLSRSGSESGSAVKSGLAEEGNPLLQDLGAPCLNDPQDISQNALRNLGIVVAQQTLPGPCNPYFCGVGRRSPLRYMNMYRFQGVVLICPEIYPIWADLKNLRHVQSLPAGQIPGLGGQWIQ